MAFIFSIHFHVYPTCSLRAIVWKNFSYSIQVKIEFVWTHWTTSYVALTWICHFRSKKRVSHCNKNIWFLLLISLEPHRIMWSIPALMSVIMITLIYLSSFGVLTMIQKWLLSVPVKLCHFICTIFVLIFPSHCYCDRLNPLILMTMNLHCIF